jgi:PAS domain S-box-containing protein
VRKPSAARQNPVTRVFSLARGLARAGLALSFRRKAARPDRPPWGRIAAFGILHGACDLGLVGLVLFPAPATALRFGLAVGLCMLSAFALVVPFRWGLRTLARTEASESQFRDLAEGSLQGKIVLQAGRCVFANPSFLSLFGLASAGEALGVADLVNRAAPRERDRLRAILAERSAERPAPQVYELVWLRPTGAEFPLVLISRGIVWNGKPAVQLTFVDLSAHKRAEEELRASQRLLQTILDTLPVYVTVKDLAGRYLLVNRRVQERLPATAGTLVGQTVDDLPDATDDRRKWAVEADRRLLATGEEQRHDELPTQPAGAEEQWQRIIKLPLRDASGQITGIISVGEDITERKRAEDELRTGRMLL